MIFSRGAPIKTIWHLELNCLITKGWKSLVCIWWKHCPHNTERFTAPRPNLALQCTAIRPCIRRFNECPAQWGGTWLFYPGGQGQENQPSVLISMLGRHHSANVFAQTKGLNVFCGVKSIRPFAHFNGTLLLCGLGTERYRLWWGLSEKRWGPKPHFMQGFIRPKTLFSSPKLNTVCFPGLRLPLSTASSLVAWATHKPLIWLLSHWCIDAGEPVSLSVALFPTHRLALLRLFSPHDK